MKQSMRETGTNYAGLCILKSADEKNLIR